MVEANKIRFDTYSEKLIWLIKLRFILIVIVSFLVVLAAFGPSFLNFPPQNIPLLIVINLSALCINLIFLIFHKYIILQRKLTVDENYFNYLSFIHIDFDIIYIILLIALTGGIRSHFHFLLIYNIVTTTFIISGMKSYFYSFIVLFLLFVSSIKYSFISTFPYIYLETTNPLPEMAFIIIIYFFAVYISKYVSNKIYEKQEELNVLYEKAYYLSITDRLTGLYDQTYFRIAASDAIEIAQENHNELAIIMMDLDNFKEFNDSNGHLLGSSALQHIAEIIRSSFRKTDILAKYGGDEFIILMRDIDEEYIIPTLRRLQKKLLTHDFNPINPSNNEITASLGISLFPGDSNNISELIGKADKALYYVKDKGKNNLMLYNKIKENL
ncbi:GGDEF domain-containing protein [candidate division WOR-3 bacterium]|nr:GGDEF domain-containing protein [candidate division WOR-3 bacterium]